MSISTLEDLEAVDVGSIVQVISRDDTQRWTRTADGLTVNGITLPVSTFSSAITGGHVSLLGGGTSGSALVRRGFTLGGWYGINSSRYRVIGFDGDTENGRIWLAKSLRESYEGIEAQAGIRPEQVIDAPDNAEDVTRRGLEELRATGHNITAYFTPDTPLTPADVTVGMRLRLHTVHTCNGIEYHREAAVGAVGEVTGTEYLHSTRSRVSIRWISQPDNFIGGASSVADLSCLRRADDEAVDEPMAEVPTTEGRVDGATFAAADLLRGDLVRMVGTHRYHGQEYRTEAWDGSVGEFNNIDDFGNGDSINVRWISHPVGSARQNMPGRTSNVDTSCLVRHIPEAATAAVTVTADAATAMADLGQAAERAVQTLREQVGAAIAQYMAEQDGLTYNEKEALESTLTGLGITLPEVTLSTDFSISIRGTTEVEEAVTSESIGGYVSLVEGGNATVEWTYVIEVTEDYEGSESDPCEDHNHVDEDWAGAHLDNLGIEYTNIEITSRSCSRC